MDPDLLGGQTNSLRYEGIVWINYSLPSYDGWAYQRREYCSVTHSCTFEVTIPERTIQLLKIYGSSNGAALHTGHGFVHRHQNACRNIYMEQNKTTRCETALSFCVEITGWGNFLAHAFLMATHQPQLRTQHKALTPAMAATEMAPIRSPGLIRRAKAGVPPSGTYCEGRCWNSSGAPNSHTESLY
jgi:hypothetical protein